MIQQTSGAAKEAERCEERFGKGQVQEHAEGDKEGIRDGHFAGVQDARRDQRVEDGPKHEGVRQIPKEAEARLGVGTLNVFQGESVGGVTCVNESLEDGPSHGCGVA